MEVRNVEVIDKLIALEQMGIPQTLLAQYCHCHKTSISKLVHGECNPSEKMLVLIEEGLNRFVNEINEKMGE